MRRGKNVSYTPPRYGLLVMEVIVYIKLYTIIYGKKWEGGAHKM